MQIQTPVQRFSALIAMLLVLFSFTSAARAQTLVPPGPTSGHWNLAGSPYVVVDNFSVPSGQTLTIDPGVTVLIGSNLTITANGSLIQAVGTPSQRIKIQAASSSYNFNTILVQSTSETNRFKYCDFANAQTAIAMGAYGGQGNNLVMPVEIMNCTFSNCISQAIYGEAQGKAGRNVNTGWSATATLNAVIKNCVFQATGNGCVMQSYGQYYYDYYVGPFTGYGSAKVRLFGNIYQKLTGTAFLMQAGSYAGGSSSVFVNNTMVNCRVGVDATDPWDARVQGNIFVGATNGVKVSGSLSRSVSYNNFNRNATNFTGLPGSFGQIIWNNRNGTPADALYNIFQDPLFVETNDFHLTDSSPAIDAGIPDWAYSDMCFPPSRGTSFPDLGAYGGPDAANWLDVVPKLPAQATLTKSNSVLWLNWGAIPRSTYQVLYMSTNFNASSGTNKWLTNSVVTAVGKPVSVAVSPYPATNSKAFYQIKSLGRTPGN